MGNAQSRFGYHVLRVKPDSPASKATLVSYFDYIVAVNDQLVVEDNQALLANAAKNSLDQPLNLSVYNSRNDSLRRLSIVPSLNWGDEHGGMLGCSVRFVECSNAQDRVWHILSVAPGGSAERAGLCSDTDYIIASLDKVLMQEEDFLFLIEKNPGCVLKFVVYNSESDSCREVLVEVGKNEFGTGVIGCEIGFGQIHQVPTEAERQQTVLAPSSANELPTAAQSNASVNPPLNQEQVISEQPVKPFQIPLPPLDNILQTPDAFQPTAPIVTPQQLEQQYSQMTIENPQILPNVPLQNIPEFQNQQVPYNEPQPTTGIQLESERVSEYPNSQAEQTHRESVPVDESLSIYPPAAISSEQQSVPPASIFYSDQSTGLSDEQLNGFPAPQIPPTDQLSAIPPEQAPTLSADQVSLPAALVSEQTNPSTAISESAPIQSSDSQLALSGEFNIDNVIFTPQESQPSTAKAVQLILEENEQLQQTPLDFFSHQPSQEDATFTQQTDNQAIPMTTFSNDSRSIEKLFNTEQQQSNTSSVNTATVIPKQITNPSDSVPSILTANHQSIESPKDKKSSPDSTGNESNQINQLFQSSAAINFQ